MHDRATQQEQGGAGRGIVHAVLRGLEIIAAVAVFLVALLTFLDVFMRYVFNAPLRGGFELSGLLLAALVMAALPLVTWQSEHVTVDVLDRVFQGKARLVRDVSTLVFQAAMVALLSWRLATEAWREHSMDWVTEDLGLSRVPFLLVLSAFGAVTVMLLAVAIRRRLA